jgi:hypothetical protein
VAKKFGAERTPEIYLLEKRKDGFYLVYTGAVDDNPESDQADKNFVMLAINDLEKDKQVAIPKTKAIGCTIKWTE